MSRRSAQWLGLAAVALAAIGAWGYFERPAGSGTDRMRQRLEKIADDKANLVRWFTVPERIDVVRRQLADAKYPRERLGLMVRLGELFVELGKTEEAITELEGAREMARGQAVAPDKEEYIALLRWLGIAYQRLGEQENCLSNHTADSCLMPIRGSGVYKAQRGSRGAIKVYEEVLTLSPGEVGARWLLNLAYQTLGEYPDHVPAQWLVPPKVFESDYDIKRFPDIAPALGVDMVGLSGGSAMEDFDRDGFLDIIASSVGVRDQMRYFHNNGDGTFTDRTKEAGLIGECGGLNLNHADYNNDGWPDVLVLRGAWMGDRGRHPNSLLRNNGDGTFTDVTEEAGVLSFHPTQAAAWGDYDGDGWLDLFIGNESVENKDHPCELYHNNRDGTFTEVAAQVGLEHYGFVKAVGWGDYDNDGRPDLYLSKQREKNTLFHNDGPSKTNAGGWSFTDATARAGVEEPIDSFPTWFFDFNNDGWLDLFVCGFTRREEEALEMVAADYLGLPGRIDAPRLYQNNHDGTFTDVTRAMGLWKEILGMGANYGDLDNDGWLDFYIGTGKPPLWTLVPNRMFRNAEGKAFQDVTTSGGFGHIQKGHGIAWGDIDNDGDQDIYETLGAVWPTDVYQNALFLNPGHGNHWITLQLEGVRANRSAFGARIKLVVANATGEREIHLVAGTGGSFGSSSLQQEVGLGTAREVKTLEIVWPGSGTVQTLSHIAADGTYRIREGDDKPELVPRRTLSFPTGSGHEHHHPMPG